MAEGKWQAEVYPQSPKNMSFLTRDPLVIACIFAAPYLCGKSENTYKGTVSSNELKRSWKRKEIMSVVSWHHWWLGMMIGMRGSWCLWNSTFKTYARYLCVHITKHFQPDLQIVLPLEEWDNLPSALLWYKIRFIHAAIRVHTMFRIILIRMSTTYLYLVSSICAIRIISQNCKLSLSSLSCFSFFVFHWLFLFSILQ